MEGRTEVNGRYVSLQVCMSCTAAHECEWACVVWFILLSVSVRVCCVCCVAHLCVLFLINQYIELILYCMLYAVTFCSRDTMYCSHQWTLNGA